LAVPGDEDRIPIPVTLAHQEAVACPEAPDGAILAVESAPSMDFDRRDLGANK
jgi:hypothetical protein